MCIRDRLCICDEHKPVCVAGVMGGANSEIVGDTAMVLFESANFNGVSVRRTASASACAPTPPPAMKRAST